MSVERESSQKVREDQRQFCSVLPNSQETRGRNLTARIEELIATGVVFQDTRRRSVERRLTENPRRRNLGQALLLLLGQAPPYWG